MKKSIILTLGLFLGMVALSSCGGDDSDAKEKARLDSLRQDSINMAIAEQARLDSLLQDSLQQVIENMANQGNNQPVKSSGSDKTGDVIIKKIENVKVNTMAADPKPAKTGKDAVKGSGTTSGKDALKGTEETGKKGGKLDIKKGG